MKTENLQLSDKTQGFIEGIITGCWYLILVTGLVLGVSQLVSAVFLVSATNKELIKAGFTNLKYLDTAGAGANCTVWQLDNRRTTVCLIKGKAYIPANELSTDN